MKNFITFLEAKKEATFDDIVGGRHSSMHGGAQIVSKVDGKEYSVNHGDVFIAAITSCTNTSNPSVLMAAGLIAKKAAEKKMKVKPWVKTSLAPGSQVVTDYLDKAGLTPHLDALGFDLVGYGCTTCIGNSGPLADELRDTINDNEMICASVLSGNRNFEGRQGKGGRTHLVSPLVAAATALRGTLSSPADL